VASAGAEHAASATEHSEASGGNRGSARAGESGSRREKTERVKGRKGKTKMGLFLFFFWPKSRVACAYPQDCAWVVLLFERQ